MEIDISGPAGNAFSLLGAAGNIGRQLGWGPARIDEVREEMKESDYEHLIKTFDKHFGEVCDLVR
jgi:hypothetical protein